MTGFMQESLAEAGRLAPHWLQSVQARGLTCWKHASMPTRRTENWKYTSLNALRDDYRPADPKTSLASLPEHMDQTFGECRLVFVDGVYQAQLSRVPAHSDVQICRFEDASETQAARIAQYMDSTFSAEEHLFAALNTASLRDGVFLDVPANSRIDSPIHLLWLAGSSETAVASNQRLLVIAGEGSQATVLEQFLSLDDSRASFSNGVTELICEPNSALTHFRLHEEGGQALHIGGVHASLHRDARLESFHLALGSVLKRLDLVVTHAGEGAHAELNGVYLPRGDEHIDYHTTIEHAVPHCTSDEVFRGIIADRSTAVFNGRIHIHPDAQKTRAELSNRNLLTSNEAQVNSKPELEIYADDVQCAHGTTVAQLDALALHYLQTRGVSREEAEVMLSFGFINELIEGLSLEPLQGYLRPVLAARFARDPQLMRHLL